MKYLTPFALVIVAFLAFNLLGCASNSAETSNAGTSATEDEHAQHEGHGETAMEKMKIQLAKLSKEDAASAEKQHMCPVTGEMLGTMGVPKKVDVKGQQVWVCCNGCKKDLLKNPDKYLAKLKK